MRAFWLALLLFFAPLAAAAPDRSAAPAKAGEYMTTGRYAEAAAVWERFLGPSAAKAELKEYLPFLGRCYEETANFQKALTAYQRALQLDEKNPARVLDLARVYTRVDLDREAIELYKHARRLSPGQRDVTLALARLYLKTGQHADARREGEQYVQWEPRDPAGQTLLADLDEAAGQLASAARRRETLVAQNPSPEGFFNVGRLWIRAGQWDMADNAFQQAENLGVRTGALYLHRGVVAWIRGDAASASAFWKKALDRHPGLGAAHFFLAILEEEKGRGAEAGREARLASDGAMGKFLKELAGDLPAATGGKK